MEKKEVTSCEVLCYYANIMDYFRVVSAMYAFYIAKENPVAFVICYFISFLRRLKEVQPSLYYS